MQLGSIDTWATILSYFQDTDIEPVNPDQFISIMKMSFVNKSLRNLIITNSFWVLYNSIEYQSVKYNIYEWNCNFCRIVSKIRTLKTINNMEKGYEDNRNAISIRLWYNPNWHTFSIHDRASIYESTEHIVSAIFHRFYTWIENEYCVIFQICGTANNFFLYMKKQSFVSCNYKLKDFADFCEVYDNENDLLKNINQFKYFQNSDDIIHLSDNIILHDNYIWSLAKRQKAVLREESTEISMHFNTNYIIKFYAYNVMTNIKYLVNKIEIIGSSSENNCLCFFVKDYKSTR